MLRTRGASLMDEKDLKQIQLQLAYCVAVYGDQPEEFLYKLENLIVEWFLKGLNKSKT